MYDTHFSPLLNNNNDDNDHENCSWDAKKPGFRKIVGSLSLWCRWQAEMLVLNKAQNPVAGDF